MRYSQLFGKTLRQAPKDETALNAQLLQRGGFVDKLMAGSYTFLPLGWRVEQKIEQIVREEMNAIGGQEVLMPLVHPKEIWNETGRWSDPRVKEIMYQFKTEAGREYGLSFTHEEIVLDLVRKNTVSHKNLPIKLYHFSTKFRNETRVKSGLLRGREFIMKDLYSLHATQDSLDEFYWQVKDAYLKIFDRIGLKNVKVVEAAGGVFTAGNTHEFQVLNPIGEDIVYVCSRCDWAQNKEIFSGGDSGGKCPQCSAGVKEASSIEVGNIFRFGTSYSEKMKVNFTDADGSLKPLFLGSYGIGVSRLMGVLAEIFNDEQGLVWPRTVAPYLIHLISLGEAGPEGERLYNQLNSAGLEVLWDDRDESAGVKLADADLIGLPYRLVVSDKSLEKKSVEVKARGSEQVEMIGLDEAVKWAKHL
ncbi:MAG: hypothetical protein HY454_01085 [Parcubacteria group bacterium]|nr:hypothetical protein [Parcubacteria group bacterium]